MAGRVRPKPWRRCPNRGAIRRARVVATRSPDGRRERSDTTAAVTSPQGVPESVDGLDSVGTRLQSVVSASWTATSTAAASGPVRSVVGPSVSVCLRENPLWATKSGSRSSMAAAKAVRRPGAVGHGGPTVTLDGKDEHHPRGALPAVGCYHAEWWTDRWCVPVNRSPLCSRVRAVTVAVKLPCWLRWWLTVLGDVGQRTTAPAPSIQSASTDAQPPPDATTSRHHQRAHRLVSQPQRWCCRHGGLLEHHMAFVPPNPKDDTAALRGRPVDGHSSARQPL